jgi:hypothetical protein
LDSIVIGVTLDDTACDARHELYNTYF